MARNRWHPSRLPRHSTPSGRFDRGMLDAQQVETFWRSESEVTRMAEWLADCHRCCVLVTLPEPGRYSWQFERPVSYPWSPTWYCGDVLAVCHPYRATKHYQPGEFAGVYLAKAYQKGAAT